MKKEKTMGMGMDVVIVVNMMLFDEEILTMRIFQERLSQFRDQ
jgi:hypothetical protein